MSPSTLLLRCFSFSEAFSECIFLITDVGVNATFNGACKDFTFTLIYRESEKVANYKPITVSVIKNYFEIMTIVLVQFIKKHVTERTLAGVDVFGVWGMLTQGMDAALAATIPASIPALIPLRGLGDFTLLSHNTLISIQTSFLKYHTIIESNNLIKVSCTWVM